jgi:subfamily B ATP-binding cassette protein MsbA
MWALPATVLLGMISSLAESAGLSLFVPLLQSLDPQTRLSVGTDRLGAFFNLIIAKLPPGRPLPYIAGLILAMTVCKGLLTYGHSILAAGINARVTHSLRSKVFSRLLHIEQKTLDKAGSGRLVNLLATDTWHTSDAISLLIGLVINLCAVLVFSLLLLALAWKLTLLVVLGVTGVSLLIRAVSARARQWGEDAVRNNAVMSEHMLDALDGLREVRMYSLEKHRQTLFNFVSRRVRSIYFKLDLLHRAVSPLSEILYVALLLGLLLIGVAGLHSVPSMMVFLLVLYRLQPQVRQLDSGRLSLVALTGSVEAVTEFLQGPNELHPSRLRAPGSDIEIEFDQVSFSYTGLQDVLHDVTFRIPSGKTTAIVGQSGSGKTTLINLLSGLYSPTAGRICLDGSPLSRFDLDEWRQKIAWVAQDAHLFSASVRENILYGCLDASEGDILNAAIQADADGFIRQLPQAYDTKIGNGGVQLSNGQAQRIALARAFLRQAEIIILDEATNALDSISEDLIRNCLRETAGTHTVIIISHRLSTVNWADQVIVLQSGRVLERGTPRDLIAQHGLFSRLRDLQHVE